MKLSRHLRRFRRNHFLLQKEVANMLNISREHYAQIESGRYLPSLKLLRTISRRLELDISIRVNRGTYKMLCKQKVGKKG